MISVRATVTRRQGQPVTVTYPFTGTIISYVISHGALLLICEFINSRSRGNALEQRIKAESAACTELACWLFRRQIFRCGLAIVERRGHLIQSLALNIFKGRNTAQYVGADRERYLYKGVLKYLRFLQHEGVIQQGTFVIKLPIECSRVYMSRRVITLDFCIRCKFLEIETRIFFPFPQLSEL